MFTEQVTLVVFLHAKPGQEGALEQELLAMIAPSRAETGCVDYHLHRDPQEQTFFCFYENWRDQAAVEFHRQTPHYLAFKKAIEPLVEKVDRRTLSMVSKA